MNATLVFHEAKQRQLYLKTNVELLLIRRILSCLVIDKAPIPIHTGKLANQRFLNDSSASTTV